MANELENMLTRERLRNAHSFIEARFGQAMKILAPELFGGYSIDRTGRNPHYLFGTYRVIGFLRSGEVLLKRECGEQWVVSPIVLWDHSDWLEFSE